MINKLLLCVPAVIFGIGLSWTTLFGSGSYQYDRVSVARADPSETLREVIYGRGCCSRHGGQCGCRMGNVVCCEGSLSPSSDVPPALA